MPGRVASSCSCAKLVKVPSVCRHHTLVADLPQSEPLAEMAPNPQVNVTNCDPDGTMRRKICLLGLEKDWWVVVDGYCVFLA